MAMDGQNRPYFRKPCGSGLRKWIDYDLENRFSAPICENGPDFGEGMNHIDRRDGDSIVSPH